MNARFILLCSSLVLAGCSAGTAVTGSGSLLGTVSDTARQGVEAAKTAAQTAQEGVQKLQQTAQDLQNRAQKIQRGVQDIQEGLNGTPASERGQ